ncbi:MAG: glycosyltransferase family 2 protein, partial [Acetobacteraceae bacterium]
MTADAFATLDAALREEGPPRALAAKLRAAFPHDPRAGFFGALAEALRGGPFPALGPEGAEGLFWAQIGRLLAARGGPPPPPPPCGPAFDFLGRTEPPPAWSVLRLINLALLRERPGRAEAAVVMSARNEGLGLLEWIAHYRALGAAALFVYANGNDDGSDALLERLAALGVIRHLRNEVADAVRPQVKAYEHALNFLPELREHRWAFVIDADEFFIPAPRFGLSLAELVADVERRFAADPPAAVLYNWKFLGGRAPFAWHDAPALERFRHARADGQFKSLVRLSAARSLRHLHAPEPWSDGATFRFSGGKAKSFARIWDFDEIDVSGGFFAHCWTKSFEEFALKKFRTDDMAGVPGYPTRREFAQFFDCSVPARADNREPLPQRLLRRVRAEMARLREDSAVRAAERE